jgi:DNA-binding CsgD family transcriptional regulator
MRTGRVYTLGEMLDFDAPARLSAQRTALGQMRINHARAVRIGSPGSGEAWLLLTREREDLGAADSALLAALAPHLAAALRVRAALGLAEARAAMAESTLALLGAGEIAFTSGGQVLAADREAERLLAFTAEPGPLRRLQLLPEPTRALEAACTALAGAAPHARRLIALGPRHILLRPATPAPASAASAPAVIGLVRAEAAIMSAAAPEILAAAHGLSPREAALAVALAQGETILAAGQRLGLTRETARNYSKRLYAKTGTSGQAQLVRLVLTGLAPLA